MTNPRVYSFAWMLVVVLASASVALAKEPRPPNLVLFLCDNLGYGDIEVYNPHAKQPTPRLNQLAREGTVFDHAYCAAPVCTPARAGLLTGCYPRRVGLDRTPLGTGHVLVPISPYGLNPAEETLAELLRERGYQSICIGKWHLGDQLAFLPTRQGFDHYFGIPYSDDMTATVDGRRPPLPLLRDETVIDAPVDVRRLNRRCTEVALEFIEAHRDQPFLLYFPLITPGSTASPPVHPDFEGRSKNGAWGDSVMEIDWTTGAVLDKLEALGLTDQTLVLWTNDNGAPATAARGGSSEPLKGQAYNVSEGGMRVPLIARLPGKIPAGRRSDALITHLDLLPTLAQLTGSRLPERAIDGLSFAPLLCGEADATSPRTAFVYYYLDQIQAVRSGPWKLYLGGRRRVNFRDQFQDAEPELYNLVDDPRETTNVVAMYPEIVRALIQATDATRDELGELSMVGPGCRSVGQVDSPTPRLLPKSDPR